MRITAGRKVANRRFTGGEAADHGEPVADGLIARHHDVAVDS